MIRAQPALRTPDPAAITLTSNDVPGWTQTQGTRQELWDLSNAAGAPTTNISGNLYSFETDFTRDTPDGRQLFLTTRAAESSPGDVDAQFQELQHDALAQTPIAPPSTPSEAALGWWENAGDTRNGTAAARVAANAYVELRLSGVAIGDGVTDAQVGEWLSTMVTRAAGAPDLGPPIWNQLLPSQPAPWRLLLVSATVGNDWAQTSGLDIASSEMNGAVQSVSASRSFNRNAPYQRTLASTATVWASADDAASLGMTGPGAAISAPSLGDQSAEFKTPVDSGGGREAPTITYTVDVRRGALVTSVQETGVVYSMDSPAEAETFATAADALAASALAQ